MNLNTVIFKRRAILGDIFNQCDHIETIPVYLGSPDGEPIGTVEESASDYSDAFIFKLPSNVCKSIAIGEYHIGFDYNYAGEKGKPVSDRIKLNYIILVAKQKAVPYGKRNQNSVGK